MQFENLGSSALRVFILLMKHFKFMSMKIEVGTRMLHNNEVRKERISYEI